MEKNSFEVRSKGAQAAVFSLMPSAILLLLTALYGFKNTEDIHLLQKQIYKIYFLPTIILIIYSNCKVLNINKSIQILVSIFGLISIFMYLCFAFSDEGIPLPLKLSFQLHQGGSELATVLSGVFVTMANFIAYFGFIIATSVRSQFEERTQTAKGREE